MALIKKSQLGAAGLKKGAADLALPEKNPKPARSTGNVKTKPFAKDAGVSKQTQSQRSANGKAQSTEFQLRLSERMAAASSQLAAGLNQTAAAAEELEKSMLQITAGAEEASSAAQESLSAVNEVTRTFRQAKLHVDTSQQTIQNLHGLISSVSAVITDAISNVGLAAQRQIRAVSEVRELEKQVIDIGEVATLVARVADQTNLLSLNAAIEAARAGRHGKGFAVVAEEIRTLAESAEKSAHDIQGVIAEIQAAVRAIAQDISRAADLAQIEVGNAQTLNVQLGEVRIAMDHISADGDAISLSSLEASNAATELQKGAEVIAAAAEEQVAACEESSRMLAEQTLALSQGSQSAVALMKLAEDLLHSRAAVQVEEAAALAEEMSAAIEEINRAAGQIKIALAQISKGSQHQSAAAEESAVAASNIEEGSAANLRAARLALQNGEAMLEILQAHKKGIRAMAENILAGVAVTQESATQARSLEKLSQRINKIVGAIAQISVQTNMLAVSGAIEGARASEFGKGFTTVSADIRNLSRESAEHSERIKDLIEQVQAQVIAVRRGLEESAAANATESDKAQRVLSSVEQLEQEMGKVSIRLDEIAAGAGSMAVVLSEVKLGTEQIATVATEAEAAIAQALTAATQQSRGAEELAAAVEEIAALADSMHGT